MNHGTNKRWEAGCRCHPCLKAHKRYLEKLRKSRKNRGLQPAYGKVDADPVRKHLETLLESGFSKTALANRSGVPFETVKGIVRRPSHTVQARTASKILAVSPVSSWGFVWSSRESFYIPAAGTMRRLRALAFMGYPATRVGRAAGLDHDKLKYIRSGRAKTVLRRTAEGVKRFYDWAVVRDAPTDRAAEQCRRYAVSKGWRGPGVWRDIDNPHIGPDTVKE